MYYDVSALKAEADCRTVASFIGMRLSGRYCECVSGLHDETQLNHCAIYKDRIHCFSCGNDQDVIGMVKSYYANVLGTPIAYGEACRIIGDACGGSELYLDRNGKQQIKQMPFDRSELALLHLDTPCTDTSGPARINMQRLFLENEPMFYGLIQRKAEEELEKIRKLKNVLGTSSYEAKLRAVLDERTAVITRLLKRAGGDTPEEVADFVLE